MITATNLALWRGEKIILQNFSLAVPAGQGVWLCGANGAGKSSLLRALAGLLLPVAGSIHCEDTKIFVDTKSGFMPALSAQQNLAAWCALNQLAAPEILAALAQMGAEALANQPVAMLSTGQVQRVSLARLLLSPAKLWLLDEPLANLDAAGQGLLVQHLQQHLAAGGAVIAATHAPLALAGFSAVDVESQAVPHAA